MPPAVIAGVGAVAGAGASLIGSSKNSKAINQAAAAQERAAAEQTALQREVYGKNEAHLSPFIDRGNVAGNTIQAALGLASGGNAAGGALDAYEAFKRSTGYQSRLDEGMRSLNAGYAGRGVLQSGPAVKSALRYGQDYASGEFGNWLGALGNQQGVGLSGASALAGVGQGFANSMGQISQNQANFAGQAAVARANNSNNLFGALGGIAGQTAGALSSYAPAISTPAYNPNDIRFTNGGSFF